MNTQKKSKNRKHEKKKEFKSIFMHRFSMLCMTCLAELAIIFIYFFPPFHRTKRRVRANQPIAKGMLLCLFISFKDDYVSEFFPSACNIQDFCLGPRTTLSCHYNSSVFIPYGSSFSPRCLLLSFIVFSSDLYMGTTKTKFRIYVQFINLQSIFILFYDFVARCISRVG